VKNVVVRYGHAAVLRCSRTGAEREDADGRCGGAVADVVVVDEVVVVTRCAARCAEKNHATCGRVVDALYDAVEHRVVVRVVDEADGSAGGVGVRNGEV